jgi:threonine/homoserine/homoserine lactone efflux protein
MALGFFLKGIAIGAVIALPAGPVGLLCIRRTIDEGPLAGLVSGLGAAIADTVFGIVTAFGLGVVSHWLLGYRSLLTAGGACLLVLVGIKAMLAEPTVRGGAPYRRGDLLGDFISTFALTLANPITTLALFGMFAATGFGGAQATFGVAALLVSGVLAGSLLWWLALTFGVARYCSALSPHRRLWIGRGSGAILLLSGAGLLIVFARNHIG